MSRLCSFGIILGSTALLLVGIEVALSVWVYPNKGYAEEIFCQKEFAFTANCSNPSPLFHFRIAALALRNAINQKPKYVAREFEALDRSEREKLDPWKGRRSRRDPLPWDESSFVEFAYDQAGRRVSGAPLSKKSKFLAFFGGSWTHGDWLPYGKTLPGQMEKQMPDFQIYNYGIQGGGLQELFLASHAPDFLRDLPEKNGIYVYVYKWMHMDRLKPSVAYVPGHFNSPIAEYVDEKKIGYGGSFYQAFPVLVPALTFVYYSGIGRYFGLSRQMIPQWSLERFFCYMLVQTRDRLESLNKHARFVVLLYEHKNHRDAWRVPLRCLEQHKIPYFAPLITDNIVENYLPDGHPDGETHKKVAGRFGEWLKGFRGRSAWVERDAQDRAVGRSRARDQDPLRR